MNEPQQKTTAGSTLQAYKRCREKWRRWLLDDQDHAFWPQIYAMLLADMTFRTIVAAAEADPESALHCPILARAIVTGYPEKQALAVRRLVDDTRNVMSLRKLVGELRNSLGLMTRENFVCADGQSYDENENGHLRFDRLAGVDEAARRPGDHIPRRLITKLDAWLNTDEINAVKKWADMSVAHSGDLTARNVSMTELAPAAETVAAAQRQIVRVAEAISCYLLGGPVHGAIIPVFQYSQFQRFEMLLRNPGAMKIAQERWKEMADERDKWTDGLIEELLE